MRNQYDNKTIYEHFQIYSQFVFLNHILIEKNEVNDTVQHDHQQKEHIILIK